MLVDRLFTTGLGRLSSPVEDLPVLRGNGRRRGRRSLVRRPDGVHQKPEEVSLGNEDTPQHGLRAGMKVHEHLNDSIRREVRLRLLVLYRGEELAIRHTSRISAWYVEHQHGFDHPLDMLEAQGLPARARGAEVRAVTPRSIH